MRIRISMWADDQKFLGLDYDLPQYKMEEFEPVNWEKLEKQFARSPSMMAIYAANADRQSANVKHFYDEIAGLFSRALIRMASQQAALDKTVQISYPDPSDKVLTQAKGENNG